MSETVAGLDGWEPDTDADEGAEGEKAGRGKKTSQSNQLVAIGQEHYNFGKNEKGEPFAVLKQGPKIAQPIRGSGSLGVQISGHYYKRHGRVPSATARTEAMAVLESFALEAEPSEVHLRVASTKTGLAVDLGDSNGNVVVIEPGEYFVVRDSKVLFRRSELIGPMPLPKTGGSLELLRDLVNLDDDGWDLLQGWLVAAFFPHFARPILFLAGEAAAGKTTAAKMIIRLVSDCAAPLWGPPRDYDSFQVAASAAYCFGLDNLTDISATFSDQLCRLVTGDGLPKRKLYTDSDVSILQFRRPLVLTAIDPGSLRGDLTRRLLLVDLERISPEKRREESALWKLYEERRPQIMGALFQTVADVLAAIPETHLTEFGSLADFTRVLAAMDYARGTKALRCYRELDDRMSDIVVESDLLAEQVLKFLGILAGNAWEGTSQSLLAQLNEMGGPALKSPRWPGTPQALSARLRLVAPAIREQGFLIEPPSNKTRSPGGKRERLWRIAKKDGTDPAVEVPAYVAPFPTTLNAAADVAVERGPETHNEPEGDSDAD